MRYLFLFAIIPFLFSCGKTDDMGEFSGEIKLSIDTVMVDAGEEFLSLNYDLNFSALSPDKSYLINLNPETHVAEKIDLNNLILSQKIQFEKEGPNGVGQRTVYFSILKDDRLLFRNYMFYKVFDQNAQLKEDLELEKIAPEYLGDSERYALQVYQSNDDPSRVIVFGLKWENYTYFILDMDLGNRTYTAKDLPVFEKGKEFRTNILYNGSPAGGYGPSIYSTLENGKIYFNMNAFNEIQIFDLESDSLYTKSWDTPLLGAKRTYIPPKEVEMNTGELKELQGRLERMCLINILSGMRVRSVFTDFPSNKNLVKKSMNTMSM